MRGVNATSWDVENVSWLERNLFCLFEDASEKKLVQPFLLPPLVYPPQQTYLCVRFSHLLQFQELVILFSKDLVIAQREHGVIDDPQLPRFLSMNLNNKDALDVVVRCEGAATKVEEVSLKSIDFVR